MVANYEFVVEDELGEVYCLDFAVVDDKAKKWLAGVWKRMATSLEKAHSIVGRKAPEWIEWKVWEWANRSERVTNLVPCILDGAVIKLLGFSTFGPTSHRSLNRAETCFTLNISALHQEISFLSCRADASREGHLDAFFFL